jgi:hypothetical protein
MPTISHIPIGLAEKVDLAGVRLRKWPNMTTGDVGEPIILTKFNDRTVHVTGTFGGATVTFEGINDGIEYLPMRDVFNAVVSAAEAKLITLTEVPLYVRPAVAGGVGTDVSLIICGVGRE